MPEKGAGGKYTSATSGARSIEYSSHPPDSWEEHIENVMRYLGRGLGYRDALEAMVLDNNPEVQLYLTWKTGQADKLSVKTRTLRELIQQKTSTSL